MCDLPGTELELFGTEDGVGNEIQAQGETYTVRGILEGKEIFWQCGQKRKRGWRISVSPMIQIWFRFPGRGVSLSDDRSRAGEDI